MLNHTIGGKKWIIVLGGPPAMQDMLRYAFAKKGYGLFALSKEKISLPQVYGATQGGRSRQWVEVEPGMLLMESHVVAVIVLNLGVFDISHNQVQSMRAFYERSGWLAFWMQYMQQIKHVVNRLSHEMLSPGYFNLLGIYHKMDCVGLQRPRWHYTSWCHDVFDQAYVMVDIRGRRFNFSQEREHKDALRIEAGDGIWVCYLCVGNDVFAKSYHGHRVYSLPHEEREKIVVLCRMMKLSFAEGVCLLKEGTWVHYGLSAEPDWRGRWSTHWQNVASYCLQLVRKAEMSKRPVTAQRCQVKLPLLRT